MSGDWDDLKCLFREVQDEFEGIAASIVQDHGHFECKSKLLSMISLWTSKVASAEENPLSYDTFTTALWLYIR
jgi:hypothetical protein